MKNYGMMLALAAGVLLAASCGKTIEVPQQTGFTLTATIANPASETKTTYTDPNDGTLSVGWAASEKMSLLICDPASGIVKEYDLTSSGSAGDKNRDFSTSGTIDALTGSQYYLCVYPALSSSSILKYDNTNKILVYKPYGSDGYLPVSDGGAINLNKTDLMIGKPVITGTTASVQLERQIGVLKVILKVPTEMKGIQLQLAGLLAPSTSGFVSKMEYDLTTAPASFVSSDLSDSIRAQYSGPLTIPESCEITIYFPLPASSLPAGKTYSILLGKNLANAATYDLTSKEVVIETGKMATLSIDCSNKAGWSFIGSSWW